MMTYSAAYLAYEHGHYDQAADLFSHLATTEPANVGAWKGLAASMQMKKSYSEALTAWAFVALMTPNDPSPHFHAAECLLSMQQKDEALKAIELALQKPCDEELVGKLDALKQGIARG